jgi:hypothetical protein
VGNIPREKCDRKRKKVDVPKKGSKRIFKRAKF